MKNDILYIPSIHDLEDRGNVVIHGEVAKPDSYPYADNMTLEDLIIQAGGLREVPSMIALMSTGTTSVVKSSRWR